MQQLIKITTEPMRVVRFSQNARLVTSDNIDMERRKAIARQRAFRNSAGQGPVSVEDVKQINRVFSKKNASVQVSVDPSQNSVSRQPQPSPAPAVSVPSSETAAVEAVPAQTVSVETVSSAGAAAESVEMPDISVSSSSSYAAQRGSFEMRVAKGDLTYVPPLVMTIITQRPQVHVEYVGGFNYVPPRDGDSGSNVNLFT